LRGQLVLDLGAGVGDQAAELAARGASVIGLETNQELLDAARAEPKLGVEFLRCDVTKLPAGLAVDGIWSSFVAAYFTDLDTVLASWVSCLKPGGWMALTEIDDLFAHEPLAPRTEELLERYVEEALAAKRYDFRMGRRLAVHLERAGLRVEREFDLDDLEFAFQGPARSDVLDGWRSRFARMGLLRQSCGLEFELVRDDFLGCLSRADHRSRCRVVGCVAMR
jgi:SAM-dependent methyltransferase